MQKIFIQEVRSNRTQNKVRFHYDEMFDKNAFFDAPPIEFSKNNIESDKSVGSSSKSENTNYLSSSPKKSKLCKINEEYDEPYKGWKHMADIILSK